MASLTPFIHRKIVVLPDDHSVYQAARAMCENHIGCLVATHGGRISGILTDRDLVCSILAEVPGNQAQSASLMQIPISEVMTHDPLTVTDKSDLEEVLELMEGSGVRRIPVVAPGPRGERCVGLVTLDDLIVSKSIDPIRLARVVQSQIFRRRRQLSGPPDHSFAAAAWRAEVRSEAHTEQTLNRFYNRIGAITGLADNVLPAVTRFLLSSILRRLHYTAAAHLIEQLPHALQEDLLDLPAGPDRSVEPDWMFRQMGDQFGFDEETARSVTCHFCMALDILVGAHQLQHMKAQLPEEFRVLFTALDTEAA